VKEINYLLIFVSLVMFCLFFIGGPDYYSARSFKAFWDLGHVVFFALAVYLSLVYSKSFSARFIGFQVFTVVAVSLILGLLIEVLQYGLSRNPNLADMARNIVGALVGILWFSPKRYDLSSTLVLFLKSIITIVLVFHSYIIATMLLDEWRLKNDRPALSSFNSSLELGRWVGGAKFSLVDTPLNQGRYSLKTELDTGKYSGVSLRYFYEDWRGYESLVLTIFNPDIANINITVKIYDQLHRNSEQLYADRYNRGFVIHHGWNKLIIDLAAVEVAPEARLMRMSSIASVGFFTKALKEPKTLYVGGVKLIEATP
jgi:VanZ family protein